MIIETSAYNFLSGCLSNVYKYAADNGLLTEYNDLPYGLQLKETWQDPLDETLRFFPIDYQDFWICQDVNTMFSYMGCDVLPRGGHLPKVGYTYKNPFLPRQPQVHNYDQLLTQESNAEDGYRVAVRSYDYSDATVFWPRNVAYLCAENDAPGLMGRCADGQITWIENATSPNGFWRNALNSISTDDGNGCAMLSGVNEIWAAIHTTPIQPFYALSSPTFTLTLSSALDSFTKNVLRIEYQGYRSLSSADDLSVAEDSGWNVWANAVDGLSRLHEWQRYSPLDSWTENYGTPTQYEEFSQYIQWGYGSYASGGYPVGCVRKSYRPPMNNEGGKNFRFYIQSPAFCYYGNLSVDVYQTWVVDWYDSTTGRYEYSYFWRKHTLEMERSDCYAGNYPEMARYIMQSKKAFSFEELFCLWNPTNHTAAKTEINALRRKAGLSDWLLPEEGQIAPSRSEARKYAHSAGATVYQTWLVWKWQHPLIMPAGYHFTNQDDPA